MFFLFSHFSILTLVEMRLQMWNAETCFFILTFQYIDISSVFGGNKIKKNYYKFVNLKQI